MESDTNGSGIKLDSVTDRPGRDTTYDWHWMDHELPVKGNIKIMYVMLNDNLPPIIKYDVIDVNDLERYSAVGNVVAFRKAR